MPSDKELKDRIESIRDTRKITNAMYMISSSKLQQAKRRLKETEPYFYQFQQQLGMILNYAPDITHRYFANDPDAEDDGIHRVAYVVITADKGMAGSYNQNVLKMVMQRLRTDRPYKLLVVGELGRQFFLKQGIHVDENFLYTAQNPTMARARAIVAEILAMFDSSEIDEVYVVYTKMLSSIAFEPTIACVLPLDKANYPFTENEQTKGFREFTMYPSPERLVESMIPAYLIAFIYGALVESYASEQDARMVAMQTATDSSDQMLDTLSIEYNRVRQGAITQEITEIAGGAKALRQKNRQ